jgi:hypothetical protein
MTEPVRLLGEGRAALDLSRGVQYVVRETDAERAEEIAGEFYPNGEAAAEEPVEPAIGQSERDEQLARICDLARRLGCNGAKMKMLLGQWAGNLAGLEHKLLNQLDEQPGTMPAGNGNRVHNSLPKNETKTGGRITSNPPVALSTGESAPPVGGFLF